MKEVKFITKALKTFFSIKVVHKPKISDKKTLLSKWYTPTKPVAKSSSPVITWIGQATFLIQIDGINILTDPIFYQPSLLFPRLIAPGIAIEDLPKIDAILISHNHKDHMDKKSLYNLKHHKPTILIPNNLGKWFYKKGFTNVKECLWGDSYKQEQTTFTFLPAKHWAGTHPFDINTSKPGSWMIETKKNVIYFAGDTAYDNHFKEINASFPNIDTALLPIAPVEPRKFNAHAHIDPKEAIQAFIDLKAKHFIPMHWGTFQLSIDPFETPINLLEQHWQSRKEELQNKKLLITKFGQAISF